MNWPAVQQIADAVLYEGHTLYPYRASSVKNRHRWNFGVIYPESYARMRQEAEPCTMQTQCLIHGVEATLEVKIRFLHLISRTVGRLSESVTALPEHPDCQLVEELKVGAVTFRAWQESVEREVIACDVGFRELLAESKQTAFSFPGFHERQPLTLCDGKIGGILQRDQQAIEGVVELSAEPVKDDVVKVTILIRNRTTFDETGSGNRDAALLQSLVSTHTILGVTGGECVSLIDPPEALRVIAADCRNIGTWPVLAGHEGQRAMMLSSPIILYDYPQIAPESPGNFFDGTEIDEILALRIQTLTEDEKQQARQDDEHAREVIDRTDALPPEYLWKLHGAVRGLKRAE